jgi:hypothetical protein
MISYGGFVEYRLVECQLRALKEQWVLLISCPKPDGHEVLNPRHKSVNAISRKTDIQPGARWLRAFAQIRLNEHG